MDDLSSQLFSLVDVPLSQPALVAQSVKYFLDGREFGGIKRAETSGEGHNALLPWSGESVMNSSKRPFAVSGADDFLRVLLFHAVGYSQRHAGPLRLAFRLEVFGLSQNFLHVASMLANEVFSL
ncbi:hypothetical protein ACSBOB_11505 [Mesorhizobium sp. ASY16-5R]|uniref:hypothetical protein n=1 Tax=Mesorhizobium sp. ASY16-5R TaxID=3445772 RepID=UPI003FA0C102